MLYDHSSDQNCESWLNFLDEIDEYLNSIEVTLLEIESRTGNIQQMDAALRAIHTVKGAGSMIGCPLLSELAHRLEDFLKIIRVRKHALEITPALKTLLLQGLDCLRHVSILHRQSQVPAPNWVEEQANPIFEQLRAQLGELQSSDDIALLDEEMGGDTVLVMFEQVVEGLLERLESVLADAELPCLREELELTTEELGELGQMLQLERFTQLCQSIAQQLALASPEQVEPIAWAALEVWQRSQALVLVNELEKLPTQIELPSSVHSVDSNILDSLPQAESEVDRVLRVENVLPADVLPADVLLPVEEGSEPVLNQLSDQLSEPVAQVAVELDSLDLDSLDLDSLNLDALDLNALDLNSPTEINSVPVTASTEAEWGDRSAQTHPSSLQITLSSSTSSHPLTLPEALVVSTEQFNTSAPALQDLQEHTVRVPIKLLVQLSDLFGELIIQRNTLNSRLGQLEGSIELFSQRMQTLEHTNLQLQASVQPAHQRDVFTAPDIPTIPMALESGSSGSRTLVPLTQSDSPKLVSYQYGFDALELESYSSLQLLFQEQKETIVQLQEIAGDVKLNLNGIDQAASDLNRIARELQTNVTRARMRPLSDIVERFPRTVRDLCLQCGKSVDLKLHGSSILIDRFILEALRDPLMHLLRNAFDHGIEEPEVRQLFGKSPQGTIEIRAAYRGNQTLISIQDDGAGINFDKIRSRAHQLGFDTDQLDRCSQSELLQLIFEPGFSTASQVTGLSGRGIGMDVVRTHIERVRGTIRIDTQPGQGTTFTISIPLTLSIMQVLLVESAGMRMAFPTESVEAMISFKSVQTFDVPGQEVIMWEGLTVPLIRLSQWFNFHCVHRVAAVETRTTPSEPAILLVQQAEQFKGIYIDRFWREQEVVIRQVENIMNLPPGFTGCTILDDGQIVPLVDVIKLLDWVNETPIAHSGDTPLPQRFSAPLVPNYPPEAVVSHTQKSRILVVDDSINMRRILATALVREGYQVEEAKDGQVAIERLRGGLAVQAIICDIEMPRLSGYGVLTEVRSDNDFKDLPVILLTSRSGQKHRKLAMRLGASAYVTKPYQAQELLKILKQLLTV